MNTAPPATGPPAGEARRALRPLGGEDIAEVRNRFLAVNRERLTQARNALSPRQQAFLELLPFLFHVNHPALPGFVATDCPAGVAAYGPTEATLRAARRVARSFDYRRKAPRRFDIEAIYLMGSAGTIAYSRRSDFDIWLCHRPDLPEDGLDRLREKAALVSSWAGELGLEVYFFVMTAADFKNGRMDALSKESSGTAQRHLLLDEFYRTAMLTGGRFPIWWLVPPEHEADYEAYTRKLIDQRFIKPADVVDFGGLAHMPSNEFFGASLWQIYKAMDAPYKSILKILLLECYASEFPRVDLLSHRYKENIYGGRVGLEDIDPYIQLFRKVERHLAAVDDADRLELARQAFFHRTSHHLRNPPAEDDAKADFLRAVCARWGWDPERIRELTGHVERRLEQVLAERNLLMNALMTSYRYLSGFARERRELMAISERDMTVLGRRLFASFERKAGKVQRVFEGFTHELYEPRLSIERWDNGEAASWLLYRGGGEAVAEGRSSLHRAYTLVEMLAWCHFNGVVQSSTHVTAGVSSSTAELREIDAIRQALRRHFPQEAFRPPGMDALSRPSIPLQACLFINVGVKPEDDYRKRLAALRSGRDDPLNSGPGRKSLITQLDLVYATSWNEVFAFHYAGDDGLRDCLADLLMAHAEAARQGSAFALETFCFSADRGMAFAGRMRELHRDITSRLGANGGRFILKIANEYHLLALQDEKPVNRPIGDYGALLDHFARTPLEHSPACFDAYTHADSPLPAVVEAYQPGAINFLYFVARGQAYIYVVDEEGTLFHDVQPFHREDSLLIQFSRFFDAIDYRETAGTALTGTGAPRLPVHYLRLEQRVGRFDAVPVEPPGAGRVKPQGDLQVITERVGEKTELVIYYGNRELSSLDHGKQLFRVAAEHILGRRSNRASYPIYITDIDLAGVVGNDQSRRSRSPTAQYLRYKKRIEGQLNGALRQLGEGARGGE